MAVRNFYINANIDGRQTNLTGGPANKDGGFDLLITQRDNGSIIDAAKIEGFAYNGILRFTVRMNGETLVLETKR